MIALYDRPTLPAKDLCDMLNMALPTLTYTGGYDWFFSEPFAWLIYFPNSLPQHRWQVKRSYTAENYRHIRKDGSYGDRTKTYKKRFASLIEAIVYYEKEIKR